jgi:ubiquinol-cytochrome c reductase cytochrome c subunit
MIAALLAAAVVAVPGNDLGARLYATHCAYCHGNQLEGSGRTPGGAPGVPPLIGVGAADVDFQLTTGRMPLEVPGTQPVAGPPSFPREQIDALVGYITAHGGAGTPIPRVNPGGDLVRGRVLFEENCQQCHGATGEGAVAGFGWLAPALRETAPLQVAEAIRVGPGIMPRFDAARLPQRDLDALVRYVETLHQPDDRGGWGIGGFGPVGEGLVAWLLGLGVVLLLMQRIGERLT